MRGIQDHFKVSFPFFDNFLIHIFEVLCFVRMVGWEVGNFFKMLPRWRASFFHEKQRQNIPSQELQTKKRFASQVSLMADSLTKLHVFFSDSFRRQGQKSWKHTHTHTKPLTSESNPISALFLVKKCDSKFTDMQLYFESFLDIDTLAVSVLFFCKNLWFKATQKRCKSCGEGRIWRIPS